MLQKNPHLSGGSVDGDDSASEAPAPPIIALPEVLRSQLQRELHAVVGEVYEKVDTSEDDLSLYAPAIENVEALEVNEEEIRAVVLRLMVRILSDYRKFMILAGRCAALCRAVLRCKLTSACVCAALLTLSVVVCCDVMMVW
jgi:hypothetical protein